MHASYRKPIAIATLVFIILIYLEFSKLREHPPQPDGEGEISQPQQECEHGRIFIGRCFCSPGFSGPTCSSRDPSWTPPSCPRSFSAMTWSDDLCFYSPEYGVPVVSRARWLYAQSSEGTTWAKSTAYDDRNEEHARAFSRFVNLSANLGDILEIGAGPFTQAANVIETKKKAKVESVTLVEPLAVHYVKNVKNCRYKNGQLTVGDREYPTVIVAAPAEWIPFSDAYDVGIMINVIEHVNDAYSVLENLWRSIKPGGYLVFHDRWWNKYYPGKKAYSFDDYWNGHPIRVYRPVIEHFIAQFEETYRLDSKDKVFSVIKNEEGIYFIGIKK